MLNLIKQNLVAVSSGTTALHLAIACLNLKKVVSTCECNNNIATGLAIVHNGLVPKFIDSKIDTWNIDEKIEKSISKKTKHFSSTFFRKSM